MIDLDQETWMYLALIAIFLAYFIWNSRRLKSNRKNRKTVISEDVTWSVNRKRNQKNINS